MSAINEMDYIGPITSRTIKEEFNFSDLLWIAPGVAGIKLGLKGIQLLSKAGGKLTNSLIKKFDEPLGKAVTKAGIDPFKVGKPSLSGQSVTFKSVGEGIREKTGRILIGETKSGKFVRLSTAGALIFDEEDTEE